MVESKRFFYISNLLYPWVGMFLSVFRRASSSRYYLLVSFYLGLIFFYKSGNDFDKYLEFITGGVLSINDVVFKLFNIYSGDYNRLDIFLDLLNILFGSWMKSAIFYSGLIGLIYGLFWSRLFDFVKGVRNLNDLGFYAVNLSLLIALNPLFAINQRFYLAAIVMIYGAVFYVKTKKFGTSLLYVVLSLLIHSGIFPLFIFFGTVFLFRSSVLVATSLFLLSFIVNKDLWSLLGGLDFLSAGISDKLEVYTSERFTEAVVSLRGSSGLWFFNLRTKFMYYLFLGFCLLLISNYWRKKRSYLRDNKHIIVSFLLLFSLINALEGFPMFFRYEPIFFVLGNFIYFSSHKRIGSSGLINMFFVLFGVFYLFVHFRLMLQHIPVSSIIPGFFNAIVISNSEDIYSFLF